jgi:hypothetical protein
MEIKWSNRHVARPEELRTFASFCSEHAGSLKEPMIATTRSRRDRVVVSGQSLELIPAARVAQVLSETHRRLTEEGDARDTEEGDALTLESLSFDD